MRDLLSKSEYSTIAPAPASSSRRTWSTDLESGDAGATSGLVSLIPRYVVVRSGRFGMFGMGSLPRAHSPLSEIVGRG